MEEEENRRVYPTRLQERLRGTACLGTPSRGRESVPTTPASLMWENNGTELIGTTPSCAQPNQLPPNPGSRPSLSRASSISNLGEVNLGSIQAKIQEVDQQMKRIKDLPIEEQHKLHDKLVGIEADLQSYSELYPDQDTFVVKTLREQVKGNSVIVDAHRFAEQGVEASEEVERDTIEIGDLDELQRELKDHLIQTVEKVQPIIVGEVTKNIASECERIQVNCTRAKQELKRSNTVIRTDLNAVLSEHARFRETIPNLEQEILSVREKLKSNFEVANKNFSASKSGMEHIVQCVEHLKSAVVPLSDLQSEVNQLKEQVKVLQSQGRGVPAAAAPSAQTQNQNPQNQFPQIPGIRELDFSNCNSARQNPAQSVSGVTRPENSVAVPRPGTETGADTDPLPEQHAAVGRGESLRQNTLPVSAQPSPVTSNRQREALLSQIPGEILGTGNLQERAPLHSQPQATARAQPSSKFQRLRDKIKICGELLLKITSQDIRNFSKAQTIQIVTFDLKTVEGLRQDFKKYEEQLDNIDSEHDADLATFVSKVIISIATWQESVTDLQKRYYLHLSGERSLLKGVELTPFDADPDGDHIHNFLKTFLRLTDSNTSPEDQAVLLYRSYLSESIQQEVESFKDNFEQMTSYLLGRYGDIRTIADSKLKRIGELKIPSNSNSSALIQYYKNVENLLLHVESLASCTVENSGEIQSTIFSASYVKSIVSCLPNRFIQKFVNTMEKEPQNPSPSGQTYFAILKDLLNKEWRSLSSFKDICSIREPVENHATKSKTTAHVTSPNVTKIPAKGNKSQSKVMTSRGTLLHPCPFHSTGASHELGWCKDFFAGSNKDRYSLCFKVKACFQCLKTECLKSVNTCISTLPKGWVCPDCVRTKPNNRRHFCVLTCDNSNHQKPTFQDLERMLQSYLKVADQRLIAQLAPQFNLMFKAGKMPKPAQKDSAVKPSKSSPFDKKQVVPAFNTSDGSVTDNVKNVKYSSRDDALYVFQTVLINNEEALVFYDSGATGNLVLGSFAERHNFKVIDPRTQLIGALGNHMMYTEYGTYLGQLGPDLEGAYHEILFQGISKITDKYPKYDLGFIASEVQNSGKLPKEASLPSHVGGRSVDMLIGIQNPELVPKRLFFLPSGIGVYEAPFRDSASTHYAFGGSHYSITKTNKQFGHVSFNRMTILLTQMASAYYGAPWLDTNLEIPSKPRPLLFPLGPHSTSLHSSTPLTCENSGPLIQHESDIVIEPLCKHFCIHVMSTIAPQSEDSAKVTDDSTQNETVMKAKVPLAKLRQIMEPDEELVSYRCPKCEDCPECKSSQKLQSSSIRERSEQKLIEKSISIDYEAEKITVKLPFLCDPIKFFSDHYKGGSNYSQALKVYQAQCRKPVQVKENLKNMMNELLDLNFIMPLSNASEETQEIVKKAPVQHYYPWRVVEKDSVSTPLRMIVDPSSSLLNLIVAKGESMLASMYSILLRSLCTEHCFSTDIRKLYNNLHLDPEAYPYSLFLYEPSMEVNKEPETYLMVRAWYGVASTCSQAGTSLQMIAKDHQESLPFGASVLLEDLYVDDAVSGATTREEMLTKVRELKEILRKAGMALKYVVISGEEPPDNSTESDAVSLLGYLWNPQKDEYSLNIQELNFSKKVRGSRVKNTFPVNDTESASKLIASLPGMTRSHVVSKCGEFYDPLGLFEPYKASLKRNLANLNSLDWKSPLPDSDVKVWTDILKEWPDLTQLNVGRCKIPQNASYPLSARLITCTDASANCGGACVYISFLQNDQKWSSALLTAKSKLLKYSVPRNELEALSLGLELTYAVVMALSIPFQDIIIATDSVVSLCWALNKDARQKVFVANRVHTIQRYLSWIADRLPEDTNVDIFHIRGELNLADMLTKSHPKLQSLLPESDWQRGLSWMRMNINDMPLTRYEDIKISASELQLYKEETADIPERSQEDPSESNCFIVPAADERGEQLICILPPSVRLVSTSAVGEDTPKLSIMSTKKENPKPPQASYLVPVKNMGWEKANRILRAVTIWAAKCFHKAHDVTSKNLLSESVRKGMSDRCVICMTVEAMPQDNTDMVEVNIITPLAEKIVDCYWDALATNECRAALPKKVLDCCVADPDTNVLYYKGRVHKNESVAVQDLDMLNLAFLDKHEINFYSPCLMSESDIFYAYAIYVHLKSVPHAGVESTLKQIHNRFFPFNARKVLNKMLEGCIKCRIVQKKVLQHEMGLHNSIRFKIAHAFAHCMIDLAQNFMCKFRSAGRATMKAPALVLTCLVTGACGINMCEDWSTSSVAHAIVRHGCRYGFPTTLYIDSGSQLLKLSEASVTIRNLNNQLQREISCSVVVAPPKSHSHQGRVERKIGLIKDLLERIMETKFLLSFLGWETVLARVANHLNNLPICRASGRSVNMPDFDVITANRLICGRNNTRALAGPMILNAAPSSLMERVNEVEECFFNNLLKFTHLLIPRSKWFQSDDLFVNDIVLFFIDEMHIKKRSMTWHYARVRSIDGQRVIVEYSTSSNTKKTLERSKRDLVRIASEDELCFNTCEHHDKVLKSLGMSSLN